MFSRERIRSNRSSGAPPCFPAASRDSSARPFGLDANDSVCGVEELLTSSGLGGEASPLLCPRLTSAPARRPLLDAAPDPAAGLGEQISLSKDVNSACATAPFTSGGEHGTSLCGASLPAPSALYGISVRRLTGLTAASFPRGLAIPRLLLSSASAILPTMTASRTAVFPHRGLAPHQFTPMSGAHQRMHRTPPSRCGFRSRITGAGSVIRDVRQQKIRRDSARSVGSVRAEDLREGRIQVLLLQQRTPSRACPRSAWRRGGCVRGRERR